MLLEEQVRRVRVELFGAEENWSIGALERAQHDGGFVFLLQCPMPLDGEHNYSPIGELPLETLTVQKPAWLAQLKYRGPGSIRLLSDSLIYFRGHLLLALTILCTCGLGVHSAAPSEAGQR